MSLMYSAQNFLYSFFGVTLKLYDLYFSHRAVRIMSKHREKYRKFLSNKPCHPLKMSDFTCFSVVLGWRDHTFGSDKLLFVRRR